MNEILNESDTYGFPTGSVDTPSVYPGGTNDNWGGSMPRALEVASYARTCTGRKDVISSQKRTKVKTASGNVSDHYVKNMNAYGVDLRTFGKTPEEKLVKGDKLLKCIMSKFENGAYSGYKGGRWLNINIDGFRYQIGWRVKDHYDHIHIGVKKTGKKDDSPEEVMKRSEPVASMFNERSKENLNKLIDELKKRNVDDPEQALKDWLKKEGESTDFTAKSFMDVLKSDEYLKILKIMGKS